MPESTCLHIQDQEAGPIRVVDIPWISVRIGRAAFCEVRLSSDDLADEACRLYRRGRSWHLVPVGSKGKIMVEGRSVNAACPVPFDVPFRVGNHCLTIRQDRTVDPDWQMYPAHVAEHRERSAPLAEEVRSQWHRAEPTTPVFNSQSLIDRSLKPEYRPYRGANGPDPVSEYSTGASVKDRWETRWRAVGAELKARGARAAAKPDTNGPDLRAGFDPVPLKEASVPLTQPCAPARAEQPRPPTPPILNATTVESPWTSLGSESDEPGPPSPQFSERPPVADQQTQELGLSPMSRHLDELSDSDSTPITASQCNPTPAAAAATKIDVPGQDVDTSAQPASHLEQIEAGPAENQIADGLPETTDQIAIAPNTFTNHESSFEEPVQPALRQTKAARQALPSRKRTFQEPHQAEPDGAKRAVNRSRKNAEGKRAAVAEAKTDGRPARPLTANASGPDSASKSPQVPSAKDILATHETRRTTPRTGPPTVRPRAAFARNSRTRARPTGPAGLGSRPARGGICRGCRAGQRHPVVAVDKRLLQRRRHDGSLARRRSNRPAQSASGISHAAWRHLDSFHRAKPAHWAIFMSLIEPGQEPSTSEVAALSSRALAVSPLNPTARLTLAQLEEPAGDTAVSVRSLGLSRDAASLSWCARRLLAAGNKEEALVLYNKAFNVLMLSEPSHSAMPRFSEDPAVPRYLLPGEERVRDVLRELLASNKWSFHEWSAALPKNAPSVLAAARLLKEEGRSEADALFDSIADAPRSLEGSPSAIAITLAARAEALALKSRWKESEQMYRDAIGLMDNETIKRSWWFNLADIELRLDDETQWHRAMKAALAVSPSDDISRRATEIQRTNSGRGVARPTNARAN